MSQKDSIIAFGNWLEGYCSAHLNDRGHMLPVLEVVYDRFMKGVKLDEEHHEEVQAIGFRMSPSHDDWFQDDE